MATRFVGRPGRRGPPPIPSVQQAREQIDQIDQTPEPETPRNRRHDRGEAWYKGKRTYHYLPGDRRCSRNSIMGFGLYACRNCRWYREAPGLVLKNSPRSKVSCEQWGLQGTDFPCIRQSTVGGNFTPLRTGHEVEVPLDHLRVDELMLLNFRASRILKDKIREILNKFQVGQPVHFRRNDKILQGIVRGITSRNLKVECQEGRHVVPFWDLLDDDGNLIQGGAPSPEKKDPDDVQ